MLVDALPDHFGRNHRNEAFCDALKSIGAMDIRPIQDEGWLDDLLETDHGLVDGVDAEDWMDDDYLDDAA